MDLRFVSTQRKKGFSFYQSEFTFKIKKNCKVKINFTDYLLIQFRKSGKSNLRRSSVGVSCCCLRVDSEPYLRDLMGGTK